MKKKIKKRIEMSSKNLPEIDVHTHEQKFLHAKYVHQFSLILSPIFIYPSLVLIKG